MADALGGGRPGEQFRNDEEPPRSEPDRAGSVASPSSSVRERVGSSKGGGGSFVRRWLLRVGIVLLFVFLVVIAGVWTWIRIPESGSRQQVLFYTAPTSLDAGSRLERGELLGRLQRLGYQEVEGTPGPGQYRAESALFAIHLQPFTYPEGVLPSSSGEVDFPGALVEISLGSGKVAELIAHDTPVPAEQLCLEPERIAGFEGATGAVLDPIRLHAAPPLLVETLIEIEDRRFHHHLGVDPIGIARALLANIREKGEVVEGGSTLTQQLARSLFLDNRKTLPRKIIEAFLAVGLELKYSKEEILEAYLNAVYWGHWGTFEIRGAREAARYYLGTELEEADAAGIALLVGLIHAPNAVSPFRNQERAQQRRDLVLRIMHERGALTAEELEQALATPIPDQEPPQRTGDAAYFLDAARREIESRGSKSWLERPGTRIFTTLDYRDQSAAVSAISRGLQDLESKYPRLRRENDPLQASAVVLDPASGEVRALVGGRDYRDSPFDRASIARRQPGSLFKPIVYVTALAHRERKISEEELDRREAREREERERLSREMERDRRIRGRRGRDSRRSRMREERLREQRRDSYWTPVSLIEDEPLEVVSGGRRWTPQNYDKEFRGTVTLRQALEQSLNVPTVRVAQEVGIERIVETAHALGIESPLEAVPSLALGTSEVSLLEISSAYGALANRGTPQPATFLRAVQGPAGERLDLADLESAEGIGPAEAYLITALMEGVVDRGTGASARSSGVRGAIAGKTGTTDDFRDAWFVGFSPDRVAGVWVGFDKSGRVGLSGARAALPMWSALMKSIQPPAGDGSFERPPEVVTAEVDPESGMLANDDCPAPVHEVFLSGTRPTEKCDLHGGGVLGWIRRLFWS